MADHVVCETAPCPRIAQGAAEHCGPYPEHWNRKCDGCLGDGTRVVLSSAIPVETVWMGAAGKFWRGVPADPQEATE